MSRKKTFIRNSYYWLLVIGTIFTFTISNRGGLALILNALYRLFQKGKLSKTFNSKSVRFNKKRERKIGIYTLFTCLLRFDIIKLIYNYILKSIISLNENKK